MLRRLLILTVLVALTASLPLAAQVPRRTFPVSGRLRDATSNQAQEGVLVELHVLNGATVNQVFTKQNGEFDFGMVPVDNYNLVVERDGYEPIDQAISVTMSGANILLEMHRKGPDPNAPKGPLISVRELTLPRRAHEAMEKAMGLAQKADYPASVAQFQRAIKEFPGYYEAYAQMGLAYQKMNDQKSAELMLRKSIEVSNDGYEEAFYILATMLADQQQFAEATMLARKSVEIEAGDWRGHFVLARALYGLGDLAGAQTSANTAAELQPDNAETYLVLANIHTRLGDYPRLVDDLNHFLKLSPTGEQADQARRTRDQVRQALARAPGERSRPSPATP